MDNREEIERLRDEMMDWVAGRSSWTNLQSEVYTPERIAIMDAQEVIKRSSAIQALIAIADASMRWIDVDSGALDQLAELNKPKAPE